MEAAPVLSIENDLASLGILAGTLGVSARVYHIGFVVPDLTAAVASMTDVLGVTFCPPRVIPVHEVDTPEGRAPVALSASFSTRPCHLELIQADPGSMYAYDNPERCYHLGVWSDDVAAEMELSFPVGEGLGELSRRLTP